MRTVSLVALAMFLAVSGLSIGCQGPSKEPMMANENGDASRPPVASKLTRDHEGKRVSIVIPRHYGDETITGTVRSVEPARDRAVLEIDYGAWVGSTEVRLSEIFRVVKYNRKETPQPKAQPKPEHGRQTIRFGTPPASGADKAVRVIQVNFRHEHLLGGPKGCLVDMADPISQNPSGVVFADRETRAVLSVPIPADAGANLIPWQWHAHILTGAGAQNDRLALMNTDGKVEIDFKEAELPATIVFVSTPVKISHPQSNLEVLAPPRVFAVRVLPSAHAEAVLRSNPEIVVPIETTLGTMHVGRVPLNENEMMLMAFDLKGEHAGTMDAVRFSVQNAALEPAYLLDVHAKNGEIRQRLGGYPVAPVISHDTPDTAAINLEIGVMRFDASFPAPMLARVGVPERAAVKADVDIRYYGVNSNLEHKFIIAHGRPDVSGEALRFEPQVLDVSRETTHDHVAIDFSGSRPESFPAQVFVWHHIGIAWAEKGGFLPAEEPLKGTVSRMPVRRVAFRPANAPHLKYINFTGSKIDPMRPGGMVAPLPASLAPGGAPAIGQGGPGIPLSFQVPLTYTQNPKVGSTPVVMAPAPASDALNKPDFGPAFSSAGAGGGGANADSNQTVNVTVNCGCGGVPKLPGGCDLGRDQGPDTRAEYGDSLEGDPEKVEDLPRVKSVPEGSGESRHKKAQKAQPQSMSPQSMSPMPQLALPMQSIQPMMPTYASPGSFLQDMSTGY